MITEYVTSKGKLMKIADMNVVHLQNAIEKIKKTRPESAEDGLHLIELLEALEAEYKLRPEYLPPPDQLPKIKVQSTAKPPQTANKPKLDDSDLNDAF